jgi:hypothetical protein
MSLRDQVNWVRELRKTGAATLTGVPGTTLRIGGIPALNADYQTIVSAHIVPVTVLVVVGTLIALVGGFRSLFVAVKAIALNLLSVAASFGALVWFSRKDTEAACWEFRAERQHIPISFLSSPLQSSSDSAWITKCFWSRGSSKPGGAG